MHIFWQEPWTFGRQHLGSCMLAIPPEYKHNLKCCYHHEHIRLNLKFELWSLFSMQKNGFVMQETSFRQSRLKKPCEDSQGFIYVYMYIYSITSLTHCWAVTVRRDNGPFGFIGFAIPYASGGWGNSKRFIQSELLSDSRVELRSIERHE